MHVITVMKNESYIFNHFSDQYYEEHPKMFLGAEPPPPICFARSTRPFPIDQRGIDGENQIPRQPDEKKNTVNRFLAWLALRLPYLPG